MPASSDSIRRARPLLGTFVEIAVTPSAAADTAIDAAFAAIAEVHRLMSFHALDSDVSRLNRYALARPVAVAPWTYRVLTAALDLHRRTDGLFDIAVAPVLQDLGLLPGQDASCRGSREPPTSARIELLAEGRVWFHHPGLRIDLGGIAKGFAVDRAVKALRRHGIASGLVNAGGDLAVFGPHHHAVGIRDARAPERLLGEVDLNNEALASSSARFGAGPYTAAAVIDPFLRRLAGAIGATVRAPSCMLADALTKVVMLAGEQSLPLLAQYGASALLVTACCDIQVTADWREALRCAA